MRILGIDYGTRRVGLAMGDTEARVASPWMVLDGEDEARLLIHLKELIEQEHIEALVIGMPRPLRDREQENEQVRSVVRFLEELRKLSLPVYEEDEVLSSGLAARYVQERGERGKRDDLAAVVILQSWLDRYAVSS